MKVPLSEFRSHIFNTAIFMYALLSLVELLIPGYVSTFFDTNYLLLISAITGLLLIILDIKKHSPNKPMPHFRYKKLDK